MFSRILFVSMNDTCRGPMAEHIMRMVTSNKELDIRSRGLVVLFPEPYNPKAIAVLRQKGIILDNKTSVALSEEDVEDDTLVLAMGLKEKEMIMEAYDVKNLHTICEYIGIAESIDDPYGKEVDSYVSLGNSLEKWLKLVDDKLKTINN